MSLALANAWIGSIASVVRVVLVSPATRDRQRSIATGAHLCLNALQQQTPHRGIRILEASRLLGQRPMRHDFIDRAEPGSCGHRRVKRRDHLLGHRFVQMHFDQFREIGANLDHARVELGTRAERFDKKQPRQPAMVAERLEHHVEGGLRPGDRVALRCYGCFAALAQHVRQTVQQRQKDGLLVGKVEIHAALGGLGLGGDFIDQSAVIALGRKHLDGGIQNALVALLTAKLLDWHLRVPEKPTDSSVGFCAFSLHVGGRTTTLAAEGGTGGSAPRGGPLRGHLRWWAARDELAPGAEGGTCGQRSAGRSAARTPPLVGGPRRTRSCRRRRNQGQRSAWFSGGRLAPKAELAGPCAPRQVLARRALDVVVLAVDLRVVGFFSAPLRAVLLRVGALVGVAASAGAAAATDSLCSRDISRDLRRAAAFGCTMPLWAALSRARIAARTSSAASPAVVAT